MQTSLDSEPLRIATGRVGCVDRHVWMMDEEQDASEEDSVDDEVFGDMVVKSR